ncbi:MAG: (4Fe-4S)-binding protein [Candidatus Kapabacteria bacterium]|nr:(4Fe-4S)-binding protein [Candidatus Kapabacteria bacterium]
MADVVKHYSNGEITVVWQPEKCLHSANCFRNLPNVFNPRVNPWVQPENASSAETISVVLGCPSGALSMAQRNQSTID